MIAFYRCLKSEFLKVRHMYFWLWHIVIPILISGVFLAYSASVPRNAYGMVEAYVQVLGIGFPFLIALFSVMVSEQEMSAGHYQILLCSPKRLPAFLSKLMFLFLAGALAVIFACFLFGAGYTFLLQRSPVSILFYGKASLILLVSCFHLYIWHLFLSLRFNKGLSIGVGITESLISALFLTGMGEGRWQYTPCSWASRFVTYALAKEKGSIFDGPDVSLAISLLIFTTIAAFLLYCVWSCRWEGGNTSD